MKNPVIRTLKVVAGIVAGMATLGWIVAIAFLLGYGAADLTGNVFAASAIAFPVALAGIPAMCAVLDGTFK